MLTLVKFNNNIFVLIADQVASESNIPLSPQWLYAKPADAKALTAGILGVQKFTLVLSCCFFSHSLNYRNDYYYFSML